MKSGRGARSRTLEPVWRALADPTRRRILDRLRQGPRTTGDLAAALPRMTRFGVMKHLRVLVEARLVLVRRRGRERWNHLNAVPLREIYERWLEPYEAQWAARLSRLKREAEDTKPEEEGGSVMSSEGIRTVHVEQEIEVAAPASRVFDALTGDLSDWWGAPYLFAPKRATAMRLEPKVGGRFVEIWGEDEGALWASVTEIRRNERLELTGRLGMPGAYEGIVVFSLEEREGRTTLRMSHRAIGEISDETERAYGSGWTELTGRLKTFVESGRRTGIRGAHEGSR